MRQLTHTTRTAAAARAALLAAASLPLAACAHVAPSVRATVGPRDTLTIDDLAEAPYVGTAPVASAALTRAGAAPVAAPGVYWSSRSPLRAWVADDGTLTVLRPGRLTIAAQAAGLSTERSFEATDNPVERVRFARRLRDDVRPGDAVRVEAAAFRGDGRPVRDARITYAVESRGGATDATVAADGVFIAPHAGVYTVVAECGGHADQATVVVREAATSVAALADTAPADETPVGAAPAVRPARLAAVVTRATPTARVRISDGGYYPYVNTSLVLEARVWFDGAREPDALAAPIWSTSDSTVAWVSREGVVVFRRAGRVSIVAQHGGRQASRAFLVQEHPAAHMVLNTNASDVRTGQPVRFREEVWQRGGIPVRDARVNYAIVSRGTTAGSATISDERVFVAREPGVYTVIATIGGLADKVTIVVRPNRLALGRD